MERYTVSVVMSSGHRNNLMVPFAPSGLVGDLRKEIKRRAVSDGFWPVTEDMKLHLNDANGPKLDVGDVISDVVRHADTVFAVHGSPPPRNPRPAVLAHASDRFSAEDPDHVTIYIRVVTPSLAKKHRNFHDIPVLPEAIPSGTSVEQLKSKIATHLNPTAATATAATRLDLYVAGVPISAPDLNITVAEARLNSVLMPKELTIFAVMRESSSDASSSEIGKDAIFMNTNGWAHPNHQSERGMAMLLSSLRVFTDLINASRMEPHMQDAILHVVHLITNFPPAVRALYILMLGKSPKPCECAALSQALYEVLLTEMPQHVLGDNNSRAFEPNRLLFGLILDSAKQLKLPNNQDTTYLGAMQVVDLQSSRTSEGQEAYTTRLKALCGSEDQSEVVVFKFESLDSASRYPGGSITRGASNLTRLASISQKNGLTVVSPSDLSQTSAPALTMDAEGLLAVYTGRAACADPGKDINMFRPTKNGEETVDAALIIQRLTPIIQQRQNDGTIVFDAFGSGESRVIANPDEILMICVDTSRSMEEPSDFLESVKVLPDDCPPSASTSADQRFQLRVTFRETKTMLTEHSAYGDFIGMIVDPPETIEDDDEISIIPPPGSRKLRIARNIVHMLRVLASRELEHHAERLAYVTRMNWSEKDLKREKEKIQPMNKYLRELISGLNIHEQRVCEFLESASAPTGDWMWRPGQPIPTLPAGRSDEFSIPNEFLDPITLEVMEDPVNTTDGMTYGRDVIERWFRNNNTSPKSNLKLADKTLTANTDLSNKIKAWTMGEDVLQTFRARNGLVLPLFDVQIITRTSSFTRTVHGELTLHDLHLIVFRALKGEYSDFTLQWQNTDLPRSQDRRITSHCIGEGSVIHTHINESLSGGEKMRNMCLIKVYDDPKHTLFSFWVCRNTTGTMSSVLFKYWRYAIKHFDYPEIDDRYVWTSVRKTGDRYLEGEAQDHWQPLADFMSSEYAYGSIEEEDLYSRAHRNKRQTMVLKVKIGGQDRHRSVKRHLTRMDVLKQMLDAFVNRILAYNFQTHIGLITFNNEPEIAQKFTHVFEDFRRTVDSMYMGGDTALWDALLFAHLQIEEHAKKFPQARKRILCISDGADTDSSTIVWDVCRQLRRKDIVVDSFCIGSDINDDLRTLSYILGGYKFTPHSLGQAMAICELEPVLTQMERPQVEKPIIKGHLGAAEFQRASRNAAANIVTRDVFPARKAHANVADNFIRLEGFAHSPAANRSRSSANHRNHRLLTEIQNIVANRHAFYDVYISESNMAFWKIVLQGPPGSAYAAGTFVLYLDMPDNYPAFPPKGRFITPMYHPNINRHGRICHSIFDRNWTSDTTNQQVLDTVYGLLLQPETSDPVNAVVTLDYRHDQIQFEEEVQDHIRKHATKSRAQWQAELTG